MDGSGGGEDWNKRSGVGACGRIWGHCSSVAEPLSLLTGLASGSWSGNNACPGSFLFSPVEEHLPSGTFSIDEPLEEELGFDVVASLALARTLPLGALFAFVTGVGFRRGGRSSIGMTFFRTL